MTRVRGFCSIPRNRWILGGHVISWTAQKAGEFKGGMQGNFRSVASFRKKCMVSCESTDRSIRRAKQRRNELCGIVKSRYSTCFWERNQDVHDFEWKESGSFGWAFKGSAAFSVISCEIHEITRPAFAKTRLAGKLKGLGDVRNRWEIDEIAPSRQEGLLAVFLRRNRRWSDDLDENRIEIQCRSMLDPGG